MNLRLCTLLLIGLSVLAVGSARRSNHNNNNNNNNNNENNNFEVQAAKDSKDSGKDTKKTTTTSTTKKPKEDNPKDVDPKKTCTNSDVCSFVKNMMSVYESKLGELQAKVDALTKVTVTAADATIATTEAATTPAAA
ncbi:nitric oxide synthase-interacting protein homolog [Neocloeon triangulifer]|uniref:nitric oxide synthase-interacting protein homolog n=1 Tax=Neocloeon triangulifer TaxID=2078957 RepID=UPI00286F4029|nr:nitric oxide synthase-interacting protein homolog [Neocloeon triangulifer]